MIAPYVPKPITSPDKDVVVAVFFLGGRPFEILTGRWIIKGDDGWRTVEEGTPGAVLMPLSAYGVEYSRYYGVDCYHWHAGGHMPISSTQAEYRFWAMDGVSFDEGVSQARRLSRLPKRWELARFFDEAWSTPTVYCSECKDNFTNDSVEKVCPRIRWCDECGWWDTPSDPCGHATPAAPGGTDG